MHWRLNVLYWNLRKAIRYAIERRGFKITKVIRRDHPSETSKCRERLAPFCEGYGLDIGFGGDPISETAIRVDMPNPYTRTGSFPVQLGGDATRLHWFANGTLDYVYSSHLLEDFKDTRAVLVEWIRVLKSGAVLTAIHNKGHLAAFLKERPDLRDIFHYDGYTRILAVEDPKLMHFMRNLLWSKFVRQVGFISVEFRSK
jgi:hypothetical protein